MIHDLSAAPALALLELGSMARALRVGDSMVKKAPIEVILAEPVSPGKFLILVSGEVACVEESYLEGRAVAEEHLVDHLFLPGVHASVLPGVRGAGPAIEVDSLGVVETRSVVGAVLAADAALKCADVSLLELRLGIGIGGKGVFSLSGALFDIEAAVEAAVAALEGRKGLIQAEVIPRPDPAFRGSLRSSVPSFLGHRSEGSDA